MSLDACSLYTVIIQTGDKMMLTTNPCTNLSLENRATTILNQWLHNCPLQRNEFLNVSANDQGELTLWGMVNRSYPVAEIVRYLSKLPNVKCIQNNVTLLYTGHPIEL
jgi:hypothetical protein